MDYWGELNINDEGHLVLGGCDAVLLAKEYGTPLFVMDENKIRETCRSYYKVIREKGIDALVAYASKAFTNKSMCKIAAQEGLGLDVVSGGELYTAVKAKFPMEKVYFHGNNKTKSEIAMAVEHGVGRIVADNFEEIDLIDKIAGRFKKKVNIQVRIKPGIEAHTHDYIKTGTDDSKFGLGIKDGQAILAIRQVLDSTNLEFAGIHCHIGSQIFELEPFKMAVDVMTDFILKVKDKLGVKVSEANLGGGYGIHYLAEDEPLYPYQYVETIVEELIESCKGKNIDIPKMVIEPGRSIVGEAGTTLYEVGSVKEIPGIIKYANVDGGLADNPRPALYQAEYTAVVANKASEKSEEKISIAGRTCESSDILIKDAFLPKVEAGDIIAVFSTGAYNYSMASNYNRLPIPAVVLVKDGKSDYMVKRQTYEDITKLDVISNWLK
ncbi:MAG: diaminopimelate decarboxylase [Eubacteriales bacterium]